MTPYSGSSTSPVPVSASVTRLSAIIYFMGFEPAQVAVGAPVLGEFDAGAHQLVGKLLCQAGLPDRSSRVKASAVAPDESLAPEVVVHADDPHI